VAGLRSTGRAVSEYRGSNTGPARPRTPDGAARAYRLPRGPNVRPAQLRPKRACQRSRRRSRSSRSRPSPLGFPRRPPTGHLAVSPASLPRAAGSVSGGTWSASSTSRVAELACQTRAESIPKPPDGAHRAGRRSSGPGLGRSQPPRPQSCRSVRPARPSAACTDGRSHPPCRRAPADPLRYNPLTKSLIRVTLAPRFFVSSP
jgi:hypothetical protein